MERYSADYFCARLWPWFIAPKKFKLGDRVLVTNKVSAFVLRCGTRDSAPAAPKLFKTEFQAILDSLGPCEFSALRSLLEGKKSEIDAAVNFCRACSSTRRILCPWCSGAECDDCDRGTLPCSCGESPRDYPYVAARISNVDFDARILSRAWDIFGSLKSNTHQLGVSETKKALVIECDWGLYLQSGLDLLDNSNRTIWEVAS